MAIGSEKYVSFTTYRKDGTPRSTPVWIADLGDGAVGFTTATDSHKAKRLANDNRVQLQPSDSRGRVKEGTSPVDGTAVVVDGAEYNRVEAAIKAKYGYQFHLARAYYKVAGLFGRGVGPSSGIIVTLES